MRAGLRWGVLVAVTGLWLGAPAHAQDAAQTNTNTPATDAVGPRELQNFSLPGTVTRPAETPPAQRTPPAAERRPAPARTAPPAAAESRPVAAPPARSREEANSRTDAAAPPPRTAAAEAVRATPTPAPTPGFSSVTMRLPPPSDAPVEQSQASAAASFPEQEEAASALAPDQGLPLWPWLLAAMALGAGGALLFWRNRSRAAYAGGPQVSAFVAPEPAPRPAAPTPRPAPPRAPAPSPAPPSSGGIITTRLRPWVDLDFNPTRTIVEEQQVRFDFELVLTNSGSAPAKDVLIEAVVINASPEQEREIAAFFARTDGGGDRIPNIPPLKRVALRPQLTISLDQLRVLEAGGRRVFVPLIALSVQYRSASGTAGRTAAVYLLGRENQGAKLAPFRLDLGPRVFRGVTARALPNAVRD